MRPAFLHDALALASEYPSENIQYRHQAVLLQLQDGQVAGRGDAQRNGAWKPVAYLDRCPRAALGAADAIPLL
jgi:hypothetical protein